ncbi:unnamed protein product [Sphagnum troendelagicum]|uniref:Uncharacterized protein n=1 Tax=Sphagnum troendelagicum TaxID=128251 RepID=A0ABP0TF33_9BRYO
MLEKRTCLAYLHHRPTDSCFRPSVGTPSLPHPPVVTPCTLSPFPPLFPASMNACIAAGERLLRDFRSSICTSQFGSVKLATQEISNLEGFELHSSEVFS